MYNRTHVHVSASQTQNYMSHSLVQNADSALPSNTQYKHISDAIYIALHTLATS